MVKILIIGDPGTGKTQFVKGLRLLADSVLAATGHNTQLGQTVLVDTEPASGKHKLKVPSNTKLVIMSTTPAKLREVGIEPYL